MGFFLINNHGHVMEEQVDELSNEIIYTQSLILEENIKRITSSAIILRNHIHTTKGDMSDFEEYASELYTLMGGITNLQLAPNGIVSKVYPLAGHEKIIGHDIFKSDDTKREALLAKKTKKLTISGPFELLQGGTAIIARSPVYVDEKESTNENEKHIHSRASNFWGFASTVILLDDLLKTTDLYLLKEKNYLYRLWRYHPDTNKVDVFLGEKKLLNKNVLTKNISIPNGEWYLDIEYIGTSFSMNFMKSLYGLNLLISCLLGYLLYIILNRPKELKKEVDLKTRELILKNNELMNEKLALKKLTNAVTYNSNAIFVANENGVIEYINPAYEKMTGYCLDDILNKKTDLFYAEMEYVIKNKSDWSRQGYYTNKYQEQFICITTITIIKDLDNKITGYVGICENITQKIKDDELLQENEILLLQKSKMAAMGEMFENIAHQWKQPLSVILSRSSGLKMLKEMDSLADDIFVESIDTISDNVMHLSNTVDDFRNFFRQDKTIREFSLKEVLNKSISLLNSQLICSKIRIILSEEDSKIYGISNELIQVFMNILTNARDELVKIKTKRYIFININEENNKVTLEITDNAGGVSLGIINKIFDSHFTTKDKEGTGIGLYMSKKIIEDNMSGKLEVLNVTYEYDNQNFNGAKFIITLPKNLKHITV